MVRPRIFVSALLTGFLCAGFVHAQPCPSPNCPPTPANSSIPYRILLVGHTVGTPDPAGQFEVIHRDLANNPIANALIRVDFSDAPDLRVCVLQSPGVTAHVTATNAWVDGRTDAAGRFTASIVGGSTGLGGALTLGHGVHIYADGVLLGNVIGAAVDLDGLAGAGINDLAVWLDDFGSGLNFARSDLDGSDAIGINDLATWLTLYGAGVSAASCSP